ncbi:MAG: B12-binding domain-containing radical SAM protein [Promethearchaeota archaeon]
MNIALINPGPGTILDRGRLQANADHLYPPLGMCYVSAVLKKENYSVNIIDQAAMGLNLGQIVEWIKKVDPDILGFSTLTTSGSGISAAITAKKIKKWNPNIKIVFGNRHATVNDCRILNKYPEVDMCVRDEGEYTFLELIKAFEKNLPLKSIKGITYRSNGNIIQNEKRKLIEDLDALPFPDRDSLNFRYSVSYGKIELFPEKSASFVSSRGCPYQCTFCYGKRNVGYRSRSVENILEEILYLESEGYKSIIFVDDNFTVSKKKVIKLCKLLRSNKVDMNWFCEGRVNQVSDEMLKEMQRANCRTLYYGIESANQRILDYYRKEITPTQSILAVKKARKAKIPFVIGSFVVGAPGESYEEIYNTLKFPQKLDIDFPLYNILGTAPGSDIWDELVESNLIDEEKFWEEGLRVSDVDPNGVPTKVISNLVNKMLREFFTNPKYLSKAMIRFTRSKYRALKYISIFFHNLKNFKDFQGVKSFWNPDNV